MTMASTQAGATPKETRHKEAPSACRNACNVATNRPSIMRIGAATSKTLNSSVADPTTVEGSLAEVSTAPTALSNHSTLVSTQLVSAAKRSPNVDLAMEVVIQPTGLTRQSKCFIRSEE